MMENAGDFNKKVARKKDLALWAGVLYSVMLVLFFGGSLVLGVALQLVTQDASGVLKNFYNFITSTIVVHFMTLVLPAIIFVIIFKPGMAKMRIKAPGLRNTSLAIVLGFTMIPVVNILNILIMILFRHLFGSVPDSGFVSPTNGIELILGILAIAVYPALSEEFIYRGVLLGSFEQRLKPWAAILTVSVLFAANHMTLQGFPSLLLLGLVITYSSWKTGSIWVGVIMHFINNGVAELLSYFSSTQSSSDAINKLDQMFTDDAVKSIAAALIYLGVFVFFATISGLCIFGLKRSARPPQELEPDLPVETPLGLSRPLFVVKKVPALIWTLPGLLVVLVGFALEIIGLIAKSS